MINTHKESYMVTCDICGYELPAEYDIDDALDARDDAGWERRYKCGKLIDICNYCQKDGVNWNE